MACDINEPARATYEHNYSMKALGDVTDIEPCDIDPFDVLCAGFPCFVEGTFVLTNNGYKPIETVGLHDQLLTHTGSFQSIVNIQQKIYNHNLCRISVENHPTPIVCTQEHPFYVRTKSNHGFKDPLWKPAKCITSDDYFGMVINRKCVVPTFIIEDASHKSVRLDHVDMWFMMGYFVGDGWIEEDEIQFTINKDYVWSRITPILGINRCGSSTDREWLTILQQFDGKKIPEWVQDAPTEYVKEFIHGYLCTDGCISNNGNTTHIATVSCDLALGLQRLYLKLDCIVSVDEIPMVNDRPCYHVNLTKKQCSFIDGDYAWFPHKEDITIEQSIDQMVYNFEVENDNSYIVSNTIVHNCQPFSQCGHHRGFDDERGTMFFQVMKFVTFHHPSIVILENVPALLTHDNHNTFERIRSDLVREHYIVKHKILKCSDYGIPQMRKRLFILAVHDTCRVSKYADELMSFGRYERQKTLSEYLGKNFQRDCAYTIRCGGRNSPITDRHNWDGYIVDGEEYRLSIDDALRLQGFDTNFHLCGSMSDKWKQLGNTIPTIFTEMIGKNIEMYWKENNSGVL